MIVPATLASVHFHQLDASGRLDCHGGSDQRAAIVIVSAWEQFSISVPLLGLESMVAL